MRWAVLILIPASLARLVPRCDGSVDANSTSTEVAALSTSAPTTLMTVTSLDERAAKTTTKKPVKKVATACKAVSICADLIDACGHRYGGCYDSNFCDGNTSSYPIPVCTTTVPAKRFVADAVATPA